MISKSLSTSKKFAALGRAAGEFPQLLYALLVPHADDFGRQEGDAFTVKHKVLPTSARTEDEFAEALQALDTAGLIRWYEANGERIIQVVGFDDHQTGLHKRTGSGNFPEFPGSSGTPHNFPSQLNRTELNRTEEKGREGGGAADPRSNLQWWKLHGDHVSGFCDWVCLPQTLLHEFAGKSGQAKQDDGGIAYVMGWARRVRDEWEPRAVGDKWKFWNARWEESHSSSPKTSGRPSLASIAEQAKALGKAGAK